MPLRVCAAWLVVAAVIAALVTPASAQLRANRRPQRPEVTLPTGPVRDIILSSCTACHGIDEYGYYAMDRASWRALIERMKTTPSGIVRGAVIADADREALLDWLVAQFGPDATPFEREYVVREVTEANRLTDAGANALLRRACESCHSPLEPMLNAAHDADSWRSLLTGKIATGARLMIDEVDPLVEWLSGQRAGRAGE